MNDQERLRHLCTESITKRQLPIEIKKRLDNELREIDAQNEFQYFLDLHDKHIKYPVNENNLAVPYLLDIVDDFEPDKPPQYFYGDYADIDIDYIPVARDYLKNVWAPETFGHDKVCSIGSYNSFGIKSALIDMAKVHGKSRSEILDLTTKIGLKDEDGKALTWDKALEIYPDLKAYCEKEENKALAEAAKRLLHRNRGMGKHAGGLIISSMPLDEFVPLVVSKDGTQVSSWVEGLHSQDLGPMGLVKFDLLVITNIMQIAKACEFVKKRHGLEHICAKPGNTNWSDTSYLNDPKALALANKGDLKCVFQFDSEGIRGMAKEGGVTSFDDLVAYSALYRPGPLNCLRVGTLVKTDIGTTSIESLKSWQDSICYYDQEGKMTSTNKYFITHTGKKKLLKITTKSGKVLFSSHKHLLLTEHGYVPAGKLKINQKVAIESKMNQDFKWDEIISIEDAEEDECYDISLLNSGFHMDEPNFIANGFVVHNCGMHNNYIKRKHGEEKYVLHPLLQPILDRTYGVMCYQEQVMQILHVVGDIPLKDCEIVRKAISKKDEKKFAKYKAMFIANGQKNLGVAEEEMEHLFAQVLSFSEYGFNKSMLKGTLIPVNVYGNISMKPIEEVLPGDIVFCVNEFGDTVETEVLALHDHGSLSGYKVTFDDGYSITCTMDHKFLTENGQEPLWTIIGTHSTVLCGLNIMELTNEQSKERQICALQDVPGMSNQEFYNWTQHEMLCEFDRSDEAGMVPSTPGHASIADTRRLVSRKIVRVVSVGKRHMYDLEVSANTHNFLLPNGVVTSNSHACAYTFISSRLLYLKAHYPLEFFTAVLSCEKVADKIKEYKVEALKSNVAVMPLDINKSNVLFDIVDDKAYFGISNVSGIGEEAAQKIVDERAKNGPYKDFQNFLERFGTDANIVKPLLGLHVFDGDPSRMYLYYEYYKDSRKKNNDRQKRYVAALEKYAEELKTLCPEEVYEQLKELFSAGKEFDAASYSEQIVPEIDTLKLLIKLYKKWQRSMNTYARKEEDKEVGHLSYGDWTPEASDWEKMDLAFEKVLCDKELAERTFYGFVWTHPLEKSADYKGGHTFEAFRIESSGDNALVRMVELEVQSVEEKKSKNGTKYALVHTEDANSEQTGVIFWWEDFTRFEPELKEGNLLKVRLRRPEPPFKTYTFDSPPRQQRWQVPKNKDNDARLIVMKRPLKEAVPDRPRISTPEEIMAELSNMEMFNERIVE